MQNPFESGHIKNYMLLYGAVVVIMILFFIASSLFYEVEEIEKKEFATKELNASHAKIVETQVEESQEDNTTPKFKLLDKAY
jgi:hypothetical protein